MKVGIACTPFEAAAPETEHLTISPKQSEFQQSWSSQDTHIMDSIRASWNLKNFPFLSNIQDFPPSHLSTSTLRKTSCEYLLENASYCGAIILHGPHLKNATIWWMTRLNRSIFDWPFSEPVDHHGGLSGLRQLGVEVIVVFAVVDRHGWLTGDWHALKQIE